MASTSTLQNSAAERDETDARTMAPSAMPFRNFVQGHRQRHRQADAVMRRQLRRRDVQPSKKLCSMHGADQGRGESVQRRVAGPMVVIVRARRAYRRDVPVDPKEQAVTAGEENPVTGHPISSTSSGKSPKNTTPSSTPALNGTTRRVRRPAVVSHKPQEHAGHADQGGQQRRSDSGGEERGGQASTLAYAPAGHRRSGENPVILIC